MERRLEDAAVQGVRSLVLRAGDYFGPRPGGSWFSQGLIRLGRPVREVMYAGRRAVGHSWAYLPDVAETFVRLAGRKAELAPFERLHFAGHWDADGTQLIAALTRVVGAPRLRVTPLPWPLLSAVAPFNEALREMVKMKSFWGRPLQLDNRRLVARLGAEPHAPLEQALAVTLRALGRLKAAANGRGPSHARRTATEASRSPGASEPASARHTQLSITAPGTRPEAVLVSPSPRGATVAYDGDEDGLRRLIDGLTGGRGLYRWQERLLRGWLDGASWNAVDVPTGLGKTTIITLWLIARAAGADLPRRLIYVVDRRAVVDQSTTEAEQVAGRLDALIDDDPNGAEWRRRLGLTHRPSKADGRPDHWLPISTLRGQHLDNRRWMENPGGAAIVVGTVDMIGSRLLFAGYGVSSGMRPMHAGLLGLDTLVVLDEAHLVPPFEALVRSASALAAGDRERVRLEALPPALRLMSLSATGREARRAHVFRLIEEDRDDPPVRARLTAAKRLRLLPEASPNDLAQRLADQAWDFGEGGRRVVVFCNSRRTAQAVKALIDRRVGQDKARFGKGTTVTELLVGERRYRERIRLTGDGAGGSGSEVFNRFRPGAPTPDPQGRPAILVATSAGEVGIDLDADDMVCDLVAWERMVQRLGRVNRRAAPGEARVAVVPVAKEKEGEDNIQEADLARYRAPFDSRFCPEEADGARDVSPAALLRLRATPELQETLRAASTPEPLRPPLTRPTLEAWSLTTLADHPGRPKVGPWLRGWVDSEPQTTAIWRRWLPLHKGEVGADPKAHPPGALKAFLAFAPPHVSESVEAPTWRVVEVLRKRADEWRKRRGGTSPDALREDGAGEPESETVPAPSDVEEISGHAGARELEPGHDPIVVVLGPDRLIEEIYSVVRLAEANADALARALAGRTVMIDARLGGLDGDGLLDPKSAGPPDTSDNQRPAHWSDALHRTAKRRVRLGDPSAASEDAWRPLPFVWSTSPDPDNTSAPQLWIETWLAADPDGEAPQVAAAPQELTLHHANTREIAKRIADALQLPADYAAMLCAAAALHDAGKARTNWQRYAGNPGFGAAPDRHPPLAKFASAANPALLKIGDETYRHEFGSLLDIQVAELDGAAGEAQAELRALPDPLQELAWHLVAAHHGNARPEIVAVDERVLPSRSRPHAQAVALRFARLQAAWGPWGLAWWEALLRAADQAASRALNEEGDGEARAEAAPVREAAHG